MPYCPKCHYEYNPEVFECPDCCVALVAEIPEDFDEKIYENWVRVVRFRSEQYAHMILEALRSKEIPSVIVSGAGHFGITGQMGVSSFRPVDGGYSLMVPAEFVDRANFEGNALLGDEWEKSKADEK